VTSVDEPIIRASEVGQYAYCARAWWLSRVHGYRPTNEAALAVGTAQHTRHGRRVIGYLLLRRLAILLLLLASLVGVALLVLALHH